MIFGVTSTLATSYDVVARTLHGLLARPHDGNEASADRQKWKDLPVFAATLTAWTAIMDSQDVLSPAKHFLNQR